MRMFAAKSARLTIFLLLAHLLGGWSLFGGPGKPSESDGRQAIEQAIAKDSRGQIRLLAFSKTNGSMGEFMGVKLYELEFRATIEFTEDCKWITGMFGEQMGFKTADLPRSKRFNWKDFMDNVEQPGVKVRQGKQIKLVGAVLFELTDNGWRKSGIKIRLDR